MNFDSSFPREDLGRRPPRRPWVWALLGTLAAILAIAILRSRFPTLQSASGVPAGAVMRYAGLSGPSNVTTLDRRAATPWQSYSSGASSRLAILLTDPDSAWLGLAHGLKSLGVPFTITRDYREAVRHRAILIYPIVSGRVLSRDALDAFQSAAQRGASIAGFNVLDPDWQRLFGVTAAAPSSRHYEMRVDAREPEASGLREPEEKTIRFADPRDRRLNMGSYAYRQPSGHPLATYEDGTAAITHHRVGSGSAYAFGIDAGFLLLKGFNNREQQIARSYVNTFEPDLDVLLRILQNVYARAEPDAVFLHPVPEGKFASVLIVHDVDAAVSIANCPAYAAFEKRAGVPATYFIQTKYVRDYNDTAFFDDRGTAITAQLASDGMEVGSHSVSHSRTFSRFPLGSGTERYPDYLPFIKSPTLTYNGSIFGELRVSKFLLEHFAPGRPVVSFRPGNLSNPYVLPEALESTGYRYSSAVTADDSLTHLPFRLNRSRGLSTETGVFEFPVTVEDEAAPRMDLREPQAERLAEKIGRYGGLVSILIHPNVLGYKLAFERRFVAHFSRTAWFGTTAQFGDWWRARDGVDADVERAGNRRKLILHARYPLLGLAVALPPGLRVDSTVPANALRTQAGGRAVLNRIEGRVELILMPARR